MRKGSALLLAGLLVFAMLGCSKKDSGSDSATKASEESTTTTTEAKSTTTTKADSSSGSGDSSSSGNSDISIPGLGNYGDCLQIAGAYAGIYLSALGAGDDASRQQLEDELSQIEGQVPPEVQDDLNTIAEGIRNANGIVEIGNFFDSDEYKQADANVQAYLDEKCGTNSTDSGQ